MPRFISWLAIALAAAFLVVATAAFTLSTVAALAFAVSIVILAISAGIAYGYRDHAASRLTAVASAAVSVWTIVASQVFSQSTVHDLTLASGLAVGALALVGLTAHELSLEHAVPSAGDGSSKRASRLSTAA